MSAAGEARPLPLLSAEYASNLTTFARRISSVFASLGGLDDGDPVRALVFDNYHQVPESSPFHDVLKVALATIPPVFPIS